MKLTKEWVENELKHSEALENHRPPDEEYAFYCAVRDGDCLLYTSPSPRDRQKSRMPSSA